MRQLSFLPFLLLIVALAGVGQITNTIYVPAMPAMARYFVTTPSHIQTVMAVYLLSYGISQFIYGPLSDRLGRRPVVLIGLSIYLTATVIAIFSTNFTEIVVGSFLQGCGTGVGGMMARTAMRDRYTGKLLQKANSYVSMALIFSPLIAPLLGGFLYLIAGWRLIFIFLLLLGAGVLAAQYFFCQETNVFKRRTSIRRVFYNYSLALSHRQFICNTIILVATFSGFAVFESSAGLILHQALHYTAGMISLLFIVPMPAYIAGSFVAAKFSNRDSFNGFMLVGVACLTIGSLSMLVPALFGYVSTTAILLPIAIYMFAAGMLFPTSTTQAIMPFPKMAGTAGAILGGAQNMGAGIFALISATLPQTTQLPLAAILCAVTLIVIGAYLSLNRNN
tara:strand:- start:107744 stop:108919 length:1176 start_codon:yes stop_codon:yes gene_type:complete